LGVTPMALYRHFADRDALLVAVVARVSERIEFPPPAGTPHDQAIALASCLHDFLVAHPWMIRLIATGRLASPAGLRFPEGFLALASQAGCNDEEAFVFYRTMFAAVLGQATSTCARRRGGANHLAVASASVDMEHLAALAPRWSELDAHLKPARIFAAIARTLPT
ncbi:MAG: TetR/AcrR family transcriptional regulator C-terminal domain-containing protein, partial [Bowdeniella nasicola]|nr:TetR/AcrR family transcriptional regulator C-terminal domain-containing protein [Bowdeniella nasicola]